MANTLITAKTGPVARAALGVLHLNTVLPQLCFRDAAVDGNVAPGDTINVRVPASFTVEDFDRTAGVTVQNITESKISVVLDTIKDISVALTAEQLTQELTDFNAQVSVPAMAAMAEAAESAIAAEVAANGGTAADINEGTEVKDFIAAAMALTAAKAPLGGRFAVVGTTLGAAFLGSDQLLRVDASGNSDALREARIGRLAGVDVYVSPYVEADEGFISAVDGIGFFSRALAVPMGASSAASETFEGVAMRVVMDYDVNAKQDVCSFDSLFAAKILSSARVKKLAYVPAV